MAKKKLITELYGYARLCPKLANLLRKCRVNEPTRYAIQKIEVKEKSLAATDGKRLVVVTLAHNLKPGLYHLTDDNFMLLDTETEARFPKWEDIVLAEDRRKELWSGVTNSDYYNALQVASVVISKLGKAERIFDLDLFVTPVELLCKLCSKIIVYVADETSPCMIIGTAEDVTITYIQMPLKGSEAT